MGEFELMLTGLTQKHIFLILLLPDPGHSLPQLLLKPHFIRIEQIIQPLIIHSQILPGSLTSLKPILQILNLPLILKRQSIYILLPLPLELLELGIVVRRRLLEAFVVDRELGLEGVDFARVEFLESGQLVF